jgi:histidinol-phosphate aminotransferase
MKGIKNSILKMNDYRVPQEPYPAKLNQNESPYAPPPELKRKICNLLMNKDWNRYPPCLSENLIKKISQYSCFPVKGILVGNSSNEIIQAIIQAICAENDSLLLVKPSFSI